MGRSRKFRTGTSRSMRVAVVGSRWFGNFVFYKKKYGTKQAFDCVQKDYEFMKARLDRYSSIERIVSGGAPGADSLAEDYADFHKVPTDIFKADWDKYGKSAGFKRNKTIVDNSDVVIAFWDGVSKGTRSTIEYARSIKKPVIVYQVKENNGIINPGEPEQIRSIPN